ncbi:MAG: hypothetical protein II841_04970 [Bacteroidales bacterium]|nr:hypothetical protein [Bacteroidales bacterium]
MDEDKFMAGCGLSIIAVLILAGVCFLFGFLSGRESVKQAPGGEVVRDTVEVVRTILDTVKLASSEAAGQVVVTLPVVGGEAAEVPQPPSLTTDSLEVVPIPEAGDSARVVVPIERKTFEGDFYTAVVEGYRPALVDMTLRLPTTVVTETRTVERRKPWSVTIGPQVGYGFTPGGWMPYAGVGVTFGLSF